MVAFIAKGNSSYTNYSCGKILYRAIALCLSTNDAIAALLNITFQMKLFDFLNVFFVKPTTLL